MADTIKQEDRQEAAVKTARSMILQGACVLYEEVAHNRPMNMLAMERASDNIAKSVAFLKAVEESHG